MYFSPVPLHRGKMWAWSVLNCQAEWLCNVASAWHKLSCHFFGSTCREAIFLYCNIWNNNFLAPELTDRSVWYMLNMGASSGYSWKQPLGETIVYQVIKLAVALPSFPRSLPIKWRRGRLGREQGNAPFSRFRQDRDRLNHLSCMQCTSFDHGSSLYQLARLLTEKERQPLGFIAKCNDMTDWRMARL